MPVLGADAVKNMNLLPLFTKSGFPCLPSFPDWCTNFQIQTIVMYSCNLQLNGSWGRGGNLQKFFGVLTFDVFETISFIKLQLRFARLLRLRMFVARICRQSAFVLNE